jgi:Kef-type K+ transport system membrane component KefB
MIATYIVLGLLVTVVVALSIGAGSGQSSQPSIAGVYTLAMRSPCLGAKGDEVSIRQSGQFLDLSARGTVSTLTVNQGRVTGEASCDGGGSASIALHGGSSGSGARTLTGTAGNDGVTLDLARDALRPGGAAPLPVKRSGEEIFGRLALAIAVVVLFARLMGQAVARIGQPRVMGEVLAGIVLGPTLLGLVLPSVKDYLFPADIIPLLSGAADIGLAFFMFLVGLELDPRLLKGRVAQTALVSNASIAVPMALGFAAAVPLFGLLGPSDRPFIAFALFVGVSLSITAFPVLARMLMERRMMRRPIGALALAAAAMNDVSAWGLLAFASAVALAASTMHAALVMALAAIFCVVMFALARPLLGRVATAYDEAGHIPEAWIGAIFGGVLVSCFVTQQIGIAAVFGAFVMGLVMPRNASLSRALTMQVENFVVAVLLPLFFVVVGLKTEVGLLDRPQMWLIALGLIGIAVVGKFGGAMMAGRLAGIRTRDAAALGALMNTRGLTELIVLNIGLELGIITSALFAMLVLMALVTTFMTAPLLSLIDPRGELSVPLEDEIHAADPTQGAAPRARSILVVFQNERTLNSLLTIAEPLARAGAGRELIIVHLIVPQQQVTGLTGEDRALQTATAAVTARARALHRRGITTRAVAFSSPDSGEDVVRLALDPTVDLVLLEGRRPMLGNGVPRGAVGTVLSHAASDVAVLVEREVSTVSLGAKHPVVVPFGGAEHDWTALELAAMVASVQGVPLQLMGVAGGDGGDRDASRLLANASLVVQRFAGVHAEPVLVETGRGGILDAARDAGLLVVGLSDRWRQEGLGPVRSEIARSAQAATVFVRRGKRPGALAPGSETRFAWSRMVTTPARVERESLISSQDADD